MIHPCPVAPRLQCCGYLNVYAQCRSKHERTGRRLIACEAVFLAAKSTSRPQKSCCRRGGLATRTSAAIISSAVIQPTRQPSSPNASAILDSTLRSGQPHDTRFLDRERPRP